MFDAALAHLPSRDTILSTLGDGRPRARLEHEARSLNGMDERFHGVVPNAGRPSAGLDFLVLGSRTEGTPIVLLEAMAASILVVATAVGGVPDVIPSGAGLLVRAEDPLALAEAVETVRREPEKAANRATVAYRRLEERLAPVPWLDRHEGIYASIARTSGAYHTQGIR